MISQKIQQKTDVIKFISSNRWKCENDNSILSFTQSENNFEIFFNEEKEIGKGFCQITKKGKIVILKKEGDAYIISLDYESHDQDLSSDSKIKRFIGFIIRSGNNLTFVIREKGNTKKMQLTPLNS